jgi:membrane-associated phospholipid phosphatase
VRHSDQGLNITEHGRTIEQPSRLHTLYRRSLDPLVRWFGRAGAVVLSLTVAILVIIGVGWILGTMLDMMGEGGVTRIDREVQAFFISHRAPALTSFMGVATYFGDSSVVLIVVLILGLLWSWQTRAINLLAVLVGAYVGARIIETAVKILTHRPRPPTEEAIGEFTRFAFPSGHATYASAVYGTVAVLAIASLGWNKRRVIWTVAICLITVISLSRLYLGAHWLTDVLGGAILGAAWAMCLVTTTRTLELIQAPRRRPSPPPEPANE